eukprot:m.114919 g.114919  ORF g.114919 m.114919 type:complete len:197 (+) comp37522_c0_seq25:702-1292(+)
MLSCVCRRWSLRESCESDLDIYSLKANKDAIYCTTSSIPHQSDLIYALSASGREFRRLCKYLHEYSEALIRTRRKELEQKAQTNGATSGEQIESKKHRDFIDILLEARDSSGVGMTDTEIRNEVDTFLFGGHDTTACASTWALYLLAKHPEHQAKIREEVKNVLGNGCGETQFAWSVESDVRLYKITPVKIMKGNP